MCVCVCVCARARQTMTTLSKYGEQLKTQLDFNFDHLLCKILNFASCVCKCVCVCVCVCV